MQQRSIDTLRTQIGPRVTDLRKEVDGWLAKGRKTSADTAAATKPTARTPATKPETKAREGSQTKGEHANTATPSSTNPATQRSTRIKSLGNKLMGVLGEHMADYHCQEIKGWGERAAHDRGLTNPAKLNDRHRLVQLWPAIARGRGIDAVWKTEGSPKPYAIIEAKASCNPTKSLQALLGEAGDKTESGAAPTSPAGQRGGRSGRKGSGGSSKPTRQTNGKVTQMSHGWIQRRLPMALKDAPAAFADIRKKNSAAYQRHVLFFSIPQASAHAEAMIKLVAQRPVPADFHAAHELTREWGDAAIDKVVDNRAGFQAEARKR